MPKTGKIFQLTALCLLLIGSSCVRNKNIVLLQTDKLVDSTYSVNQREEDYRIQYNDMLRVDVKIIGDKATDIFNMNNNLMMQNGVVQNGDPFFSVGYQVTDSGYIELPIVGRIKVGGLTLAEARSSVQAVVAGFYNNAYVSVAIGGVRYAVLGEVNRPGKYVLMQNRVTILEALANAGDLNGQANRRKIQLIRQYPEGTKVVILDLTNRDIFKSQYYFIRPNDVIYVQPMKIREYGTGFNANQSLQTIVLAVTLLVNTVLLYDRLAN
jgi:polysaccharide export outer membrane protein